ncbi:ABC transporter permease [Clostridium oceanicum]|uniref:ABC transporter permease n=1 Tax=Clostridium oceanicum TaxID=1543 RepID=A0ABN1JEQ6_9CLOT
MYNLIKFELYKLKKNKAFKICILLTLFIVFLTIRRFFSSTTPSHVLQFVYKGQEYGFTVNSFKDRMNPQSIEFLNSAFGYISFIEIMIMFIVGSIFINEYLKGTIKSIIAYGHERYKIYFSKLIAISVAAGILLGILLLGTVIVSIPIRGAGSNLSIESIIKILKFVFLVWLIFIAIASIYICIAAIIRNKSLLIGLGMGYFIFSLLFAGKESLFKYQQHTLLFKLMKIGMNYPNTDTTLNIIFLCLATIIITAVLGVITFKKQDIK